MRRLLSLRFLGRKPRGSQPIYAPLAGERGIAGTATELCRVLPEYLSSWRSKWTLLRTLGLPIVSKRVISKTHHLPLGLESFIEEGIRSLKVSFQRKPFFDKRRLLSFPGGHWRTLLPTPDVVLLSLIGANVGVYLLWRVADPVFMKQHFMISVDNVKSGRLHTLITSAFSHADTDHLISNMIGLYFFGSSIGRQFGPDFLLKLYIAGALGGSICFLIHKVLTVPSSKGTQVWRFSTIYGLGASAAVNAIMLLDIFLHPKNIIYLNLVIPVPAMLMGALLIGHDLLRIKKGDQHISGAAHLGGALVAALVWARVGKGWI